MGRPCKSIDAHGVSHKVAEASAVPHAHQMSVVEDAEPTAFSVHLLAGGHVNT
jgi:hypothetical protein